MRNFFKNQRGVTMVELLIITVIIGILASVSVTSYRSSQKYARFTNVVAKVMESIRTARNLAINSQLVDFDGDPATPSTVATSFIVSIKKDGLDKISTELNAEDEKTPPTSTPLTQYNYTSPNGYTFASFYNETNLATAPITIKFSPPFGDVVMSETGGAPNIVKMAFKIKSTDTSNYCMKVEINKVSGLLSVDKSCT